jgi:uncharacterized membrane protein YfcA
MKNKAILYLLVSAVLFYLVLQTAVGAWLGRPSPVLRGVFLLIITLSFLFSMLSLFNSSVQIRNRRSHPLINWISLAGGIVLGLFSGYLALGLTATLLGSL